MTNKSKELEALNVYVQRAKKWELPSLRNQCVQMIKMIDARLYGKPMPVMKMNPFKRFVLWLRRIVTKKRS
jgi:hypothetical protein